MDQTSEGLILVSLWCVKCSLLAILEGMTDSCRGLCCSEVFKARWTKVARKYREESSHRALVGGRAHRDTTRILISGSPAPLHASGTRMQEESIPLSKFKYSIAKSNWKCTEHSYLLKIFNLSNASCDKGFHVKTNEQHWTWGYI